MEKMFCYQCEQTAGGKVCTKIGVCGKTPEMPSMKDLLIYQLKGISVYVQELFKENFWKAKNPSSSLSQTNNSLNEEEVAKQPSSIIVKKEISQSEHDEDGTEEEDEEDFDYMPQKTRAKKRARIAESGK